MIYIIIGAVVGIALLTARYAYKVNKRGPVAVPKHSVWPLPKDRPGAYVNDEPE